MTALTSLARIEAASLGQAQLIRTVRHVHISDRPLVFIPLGLAGEPCAPLAALVGDDRLEPQLLVVTSPLNRDERFAFAADLAGIVLGYIGSYLAGPEPPDNEPYPDAPQLIVPNAGGVAFARLLGRSTRFRPVEGAGAVPASVPVLGRWLTYLAERSHPSASLILTATGALAAHWATGQSAVEDENLATLLAWIAPPPGRSGADAALAAEDPTRCPPAGPATDPGFDRDVLTGRLTAIRDTRLAADLAGQRRAVAALRDDLREVLMPTWRLVWQAIDLLRTLPEAGHVADRRKGDRLSFSGYARYLAEGGFPQPRKDAAVDAARRLGRLEAEQQRLETQMAYDDPLVMAEYRMTGAAFEGVVVRAEPARLDESGKESGKKAKLRPWIWVETPDEVTAAPGTELRSPARPSQKAVVIDVRSPGEDQDGRTLVTLELRSGMGRGLTPAAGSVPEADDVVCYTTLTLDFQPSPEFPGREDTPWTHGGPPPEYVPAELDRAEPWDGEDWADDAYARAVVDGALVAGPDEP
ncbi:MAG TPA: hypothetical protein VMU95_39985 [Trebonia sp.]|nr:hypothetical protein [Trebonia sp.]